MSNSAKEIIQINVEEELKRSYLDYAMSVIVGRALPDIRDGLKPVHRRILFAMKILGNVWNKNYKKSARVVGDVIGKYHPHGDVAVYETIVRMAQSFLMRYILIDGQGNFGSVDGDSAAAMRYTEIRMSKISGELLLDLEQDTVDYELNYDGTETIPSVLPTRIPNLLINGSSGIAVGMATNIPPHNLSEVINGCLAFIDNENITIEDLMKHIPGPDFPTSAIINDCSGLREAYYTGRGKICIRARADFEINVKTGRESIIICEIPYQVNKARLLEKISELVKDKRIEGINSLRDESDKDGLRIVIEIKRDFIGEVILNNLYSLTQLQVSFGINMVALDQGKPKVLSLKDILSSFVCHRRSVVTRRIIFELKKARSRIYVLEALIVALCNVDLIISIIRRSNSTVEANLSLLSSSWNLGKIIELRKRIPINVLDSEWLKSDSIQKDRYFFTKNQARAILDLKLSKLTTLEYKKLFQEYQDVLETINNFFSILNDPRRLMEVIRKELVSIQKEYYDVRRTEISTKIPNINIENLINRKDVVVTLSYQGYVKYQPLTDYEAQKRGGKGKLATRIKEEDFITRLLIANTRDTVLLFSNHGRIYWMKVYKLPEASRGSRGKPIVNLLPLNKNERITAILPVQNYTTGHQVFMATSSGMVKKTALTEFSRPRSVGIIALNLNDGDELIGADVTDGINNEVMLFSSYGKVVRFKETQVRSVGRLAIGVKGINLSKGDRVVSLIIPRDQSSILTVTKNGFGKRTNQLEYPLKSRATQGVISIKVSERNGNVIGAVQVDHGDQIVMITDSGRLVRTRVSEVSIIGRNTQGVMLIRVVDNEHVVGLQRVVESVETEDLH